MNSENPYESDNLTGVNQEGQLANTPVERLTAASIIGDNVLNLEGVKLGSIENLMINLGTGLVEYAVIEFGSFLGIGGKLFAVPFTALKVEAEKKAFVLDREKTFLEKLPGFDKSNWPKSNGDYFNEVNLYWRLSPEALSS